MPYYKNRQGEINFISENLWAALRLHEPEFTECEPVQTDILPDPPDVDFNSLEVPVKPKPKTNENRRARPARKRNR